MKKFFAIALIAASFAACNSGENKSEETTTTDTTVTVVPQAPDTVVKEVTTTVDTTVKVKEGAETKVNVDTVKH